MSSCHLRGVVSWSWPAQEADFYRILDGSAQEREKEARGAYASPAATVRPMRPERREP
jgi:hypothetical protein